MVPTAASGPFPSADSRARSAAAEMLLYPIFTSVVVLLTWLQWNSLHQLGWRGCSIHSLVTGVVAILLVTVLSDFGSTAFLLTITALLGWFGVMGARLRRLARAEASSVLGGEAPRTGSTP